MLEQLSYNSRIEFQNIFVGFTPTLSVIESIITRLTQLLMSFKRENMIMDNIIRHTILDYTILNSYYAKKYKKKCLIEWLKISDHLKS